MGLSAAAMVAAAFGYLPPVAGALLQEAIDVAVILNALRVLRGGIVPPPLTDRDALARLLDEHIQLRTLLERMRHAADHLEATDASVETLRAISARLAGLLIPHQAAEERFVFPELAHRLGGRDPTGSMTHMHEEIVALTTRFTALVEGLDGALAASEAREARRLLHGLEAVIGLHLGAEEELLALIEDLPTKI
jgi:hemerythrin-like domain-containing protein